MFVYKNKYYLIIESINDIDLRNIKLTNKFIIIYRNNNKIDDFNKMKRFIGICRIKKIDFFIANDVRLMIKLKASGVYISAHNKDLNYNRLKNTNYKIIGSAHNIKELQLKSKQGCSKFIFSRLFQTNYKFKLGFLGVIKFNFLRLLAKKDLIPLGGINWENLNKTNMVNCNSIALMSEVKKKPTKIFSRLF